jgi:TrpR family trp operon transcriptional repressor
MKELIKLLLQINDPKEMNLFLQGILTTSEIEELIRRIQIVKLLKKGVAQHKVAEQLGVGVATVTRGAREIKLGHFDIIK